MDDKKATCLTYQSRIDKIHSNAAFSYVQYAFHHHIFHLHVRSRSVSKTPLETDHFLRVCGSYNKQISSGTLGSPVNNGQIERFN